MQTGRSLHAWHCATCVLLRFGVSQYVTAMRRWASGHESASESTRPLKSTPRAMRSVQMRTQSFPARKALTSHGLWKVPTGRKAKTSKNEASARDLY